MTAWPPLDRDRFAKCRALMERGATPGERAAGRAAATRIAATAGLTMAQAEAFDAPRTRPAPSYAWRASKTASTTAPEPKAPPAPITVEELQAQKRAAEARRRKLAAREARRLRALHAEQERQSAAIRAAQGERDRAWAEARAGGPTNEPHPATGSHLG